MINTKTKEDCMYVCHRGKETKRRRSVERLMASKKGRNYREIREDAQDREEWRVSSGSLSSDSFSREVIEEYMCKVLRFLQSHTELEINL